MVHMGDWNLDYRPGGWVRAQEEGGVTVFLQYRPTGSAGGERLDPFAVVIASEDAISARSWRRVPFAEIGGHAQFPDVRAVLTQPTDLDVPSVDDLERYFTETADQFRDVTRGIVPTTHALLADGEAGETLPPLPRLTVPTGRLTDDFLRELAEAYNACVRARTPPAPALAELSGAPVRTVHRWVSEARKRGFLPPARRGQAG